MTHDDLAARLYDDQRQSLLRGLLDDARHGRLHIEWRARLDRHPLALGLVRRIGEVPDRVSAALMALAEMPRQPWEPFSAPTGRVALDSWYQAAVAAEYHTGPPPQLLTIPATGGLLPPPPRPSLETVLAADLAAVEQRRRAVDVLGASYRIALAECSWREPLKTRQEIDWQDWIRERVAEWDDHAGRIDPATSEAFANDGRRQYGQIGCWWGVGESMPAYWSANDAWTP